MSSELRRRIEDFAIDGPTPSDLPFAARLARENGWPRPFADRVVREYKRFVYLAVTAGHPVCPSEQVDAAWHLHLTYTRSYWKRFCGDVLGQPLHHEPTRGGPAEADKHRRMYDATLAAYRAAFGEEPPTDVWPPADQRFGDDLRHVVVNTRHNWVVPKAWVRRAAVSLASAVGFVLVAAGCGNGLNPFELKGATYLVFLIPVMVAAVCLGLVIRSAHKGRGFADGEAPPALDWQDAAYLSGGTKRLLTAAIARLVRNGVVRLSEADQSLAANGRLLTKLSPVEEAVLAALPLKKDDRKAMKAVNEAVGVAFAEPRRRLQDAGLVLEYGRALGAGVLTALPLFGVLLVFGLGRLVVGLANGKDSEFLMLAVFVGVVASGILVCKLPFRTRKGEEALAALKARHGKLVFPKEWTGCDDVALAVALFGTMALASSELAPLAAWYPAQTSGDGGWSGGCGAGCGTGGGCGGDGGGGGCGGGGGD